MGVFECLFRPFNELFSHVGDTTNLKLFLHPLSHEVDFMNIHKVFEEPETWIITWTATTDLISLPSLFQK